MIVLDQERRGLINSDTILGFSARPNINGNDDYVIVAVITLDNTVIIGEYNTEQVAAAELEQIYHAFAEGRPVYAMPLEE